MRVLRAVLADMGMICTAGTHGFRLSRDSYALNSW